MEKNIGFIERANLLFSSTLDKVILTILTKNLAITETESLIIVYDFNKTKLAKKFFDVAKSYIQKVDLEKIAVMKINGQEPESKTAKKIVNYDAAISRLEDADVAQEQLELIKAQFLQQASHDRIHDTMSSHALIFVILELHVNLRFQSAGIVLVLQTTAIYLFDAFRLLRLQYFFQALQFHIQFCVL